jgi:hypothetical protein
VPGVRSGSIGVMASRSVRPWRQLALWLHVITSVAWMTQALTLCVLLSVCLATDDQAVRVSTTSAAELLDNRLLAPMANASAFTGFMLAAATPWGFFRHWWVLTKFAITVVQLNLGIFVLSSALAETAETAGAGGTAGRMAVAGALMSSAIAFQAWLSIAKPWSRTPWAARDRRPASGDTAPRWVFVVTVVVGLVDLATALAIGHPAPLFSLVTLGVWLVLRRRRAGTPAPATPVASGVAR